ncbi:hypothetical protein pb186bvf_008150 [Paramecium bursaria]
MVYKQCNELIVITMLFLYQVNCYLYNIQYLQYFIRL